MNRHRVPRLLPLAILLGSLSGPSPALSQSKKFVEFTITKPLMGDVAPDFTLPTVGGGEFTLSRAYADRPVVIEFGSYT